MNCAECRDNLVACAEGLLDREALLECQAHLEACAGCRAEYQAIASLQQRLAARGQATAEVSIVEPVMRRVLQKRKEPERETIMSKILKHRWGFGLGAAAGAAAIILLTILLTTPNAQAKAVEVMTKGAQAVAKLTSIHLRGQLRTAPQDNFSYINADCSFYTIELWKQFEPDLKWRVEKPQRVVVMDGKSTVMLIKTDDTG
ncbi:MAG: zf-HC2 domain-containing protein, partial [Verrucomicrobiota bacterium]